MVWVVLEGGWFTTSESPFSGSSEDPSIAKQYNYIVAVTVLLSILDSLRYTSYTKIKKKQSKLFSECAFVTLMSSRVRCSGSVFL